MTVLLQWNERFFALERYCCISLERDLCIALGRDCIVSEHDCLIAFELSVVLH